MAVSEGREGTLGYGSRLRLLRPLLGGGGPVKARAAPADPRSVGHGQLPLLAQAAALAGHGHSPPPAIAPPGARGALAAVRSETGRTGKELALGAGAGGGGRLQVKLDLAVQADAGLGVAAHVTAMADAAERAVGCPPVLHGNLVDRAERHKVLRPYSSISRPVCQPVKKNTSSAGPTGSLAKTSGPVDSVRFSSKAPQPHFFPKSFPQSTRTRLNLYILD